MNVVQISEGLKYGFKVPQSIDLVYSSLKCLADDVYTNFYSPSSGMSSEPSSPIFACQFCPSSFHRSYIALANEDGRIAIKDTNDPKVNEHSFMSVQGHNNAIFDLIWTNCGEKLISASGDHTAVLWEVGEGIIKPILRFHGHNRSVKTISCKPNDKYIFATGARDGLVNLWDIRSNQGMDVVKPENHIPFCHFPLAGITTPKQRKPNSSRADSITGLAFQDEHTLISCSAGDGIIKVWDTRKSYSIYKRQPQALHLLPHFGKSARNGFTCLTMGPCGLRLYANCLDNTIYCYNIGTYNKEPIACYKGHMVSSFYIKNAVSPDGNYIASGSSDDKAYIWSVSNPDYPITTLQGHNAEVTCIDWCKIGETKLATCSDDATYRVWRILPGEFEEHDTNIRGTAVECEKHNDIENIMCKSKKRKIATIMPLINLPTSTCMEKKGKIEEIEKKEEHFGVSELLLSDIASPNSKRLRLGQAADVSNVLNSPTSNLPNYVIDGVSPHSHRCTQVIRQHETVDWLTKLRQTTPPQKVQQIAGRRRSSSGNQSSPRTARGSLLKFFKIASKQSQGSGSCDQQSDPIPLSEEPTVHFCT